MRGLRHASRLQLASVVGRADLEFFRLYGVNPEAEVHADGELVWFSLGKQHPVETVVLHANFADAEADMAIDDVIKRFSRKEQPFAWMVGAPSSPGDVGRRLLARGMGLLAEETAMYVDLGCDLLHAPAVPGLTIEAVRDEKLLMQYASAVQMAFGVPDSWGRGVQAMHRILGLTQASVVQGFVGLMEGAPVASACVAFCSEAAGIYNVGVLPYVRNRGVAAAMTAAVCAAAEGAGYRYAVLTASHAAHDVYRRLGFHDCGTVRTFVLMPGGR